MKIRISIKSMLIGVAYVAVVVVACARPSDVWNGLLWLSNGIALLYAALAVGFCRERQQAIAAGLLLFASAFLIALWWLPGEMPGRYLAPKIGFDLSSAPNRRANLQSRIDTLNWEITVSANASSDDYRDNVQQQYWSVQDMMAAYESNQTLEKTINAVTTMLAGLIGCLAGAHIWSISQRHEQT